MAKETEMLCDEKYKDLHPEVKKAHLVCEVLKAIPLFISENAIFVGAQRDDMNPVTTAANSAAYEYDTNELGKL